MDLLDSAADMRDWMLIQHFRRETFSIGMGKDCLHVYCQFGRSAWETVERPQDWHGVPITYHWNVGKARATAS